MAGEKDDNKKEEKKKKPSPAKKRSTAKKTTATAKKKAAPKKKAVEKKSDITSLNTPSKVKKDTINTDKPDAPEVITLPPFIVLMYLMAGIVLNWVFPMSFGGSGFWGWLGFILFALCFVGLKCSFKGFKAADTNLSPKEPTNAIVKDGLYKFSRNPIYVSMLIGFIGLSLMNDAPMMLLMVIPLFYTLALGVIIPEEEYLAEKFGDEYLDYKKDVRRWL